MQDERELRIQRLQEAFQETRGSRGPKPQPIELPRQPVPSRRNKPILRKATGQVFPTRREAIKALFPGLSARRLLSQEVIMSVAFRRGRPGEPKRYAGEEWLTTSENGTFSLAP